VVANYVGVDGVGGIIHLPHLKEDLILVYERGGNFPLSSKDLGERFANSFRKRFIKGRIVESCMARSDSFFIRATIPTDGTTYAQTSIDLGSFVDALGKTVMRIHNASVSYQSAGTAPVVPTNNQAVCSFQLTTQSQTALVGAVNRSTISSGTLLLAGDAGAILQTMSESLDIAPQEWTGGYLVAVESIFLGVDQSIAALIDEVTIVLECTVETMTASASMALALSQQ